MSSPSSLETPSRSSWAYQRPKLTQYQTEALFCPERYSVIEATTKAGKTVGCMAWLLEQAVTCDTPGREFWWVAPILDQARIPFRRMRRGLPQNVYQVNETNLRLTLANGAVLAFKGGDHPDSLYGEDVYAAVIDEGTRCKEEVFHAIRSTLTATQGPLRIIGNVKGRKNWAYLLARKAQSGEPNWHYAKITAHDAVAAGILDAEEIEDARRTLPEQVFQELYMAEPSDDGGNPFGLSAIAACITALHLDCEPKGWGWDLAKSVDWTVGIGLCVHGAVCRFERFRAPWQETVERIVKATGKIRALVDSTGVGDPVLEALQRPLTPDGSHPHRPNFEGFKFSQQSKQQLMEGLAVAIQQQQIRFPEGPITSELEAFEYEYTRTGVRYAAPQGIHDDCVVALGLAASLHRVPTRSGSPKSVGLRASPWKNR